MNQAIFMGRLCRDPQTRSYTVKEDGKKVEKEMARFTLAVQRNKDEADFIDVKAFGKLAELASDYLTKGKQVLVTCHVQTGSYKDEDGENVYTTDFIARSIEFTGKKDEEKPGKPKKSKKSRDYDDGDGYD